MKKVTITIGLLLLVSCTSKRDILYKTKKVNKSISNLEIIRIHLENDVKEGVDINKYNSLINQNIYNLQRCINPKRARKHSSQYIYLDLTVGELEMLLLDALMVGEISEPRYKFILSKLKEIRNSIKQIKYGWN